MLEQWNTPGCADAAVSNPSPKVCEMNLWSLLQVYWVLVMMVIGFALCLEFFFCLWWESVVFLCLTITWHGGYLKLVPYVRKCQTNLICLDLLGQFNMVYIWSLFYIYPFYLCACAVFWLKFCICCLFIFYGHLRSPLAWLLNLFLWYKYWHGGQIYVLLSGISILSWIRFLCGACVLRLRYPILCEICSRGLI